MVVQGHPRSLILAPIESAPQIRRSILDFVRVTNHCIVLYCIVCDFLLVVNSNVGPIFLRFSLFQRLCRFSAALHSY